MVEAGPTGISFVILDASNCFSAVVVYSFSQGMNATAMEAEFNEIFRTENYLQQAFKKINIVWTFDQSTLIPAEFFDKESCEQVLDLVYGDLNKGLLKTDFMFHHNIHNVYRVPQWAINALPSSFQYVNQTHQHSLLPDIVAKTGDRLFVIFYNSRLTVLLMKAGAIQVIQHFEYETPDDAAWHLLNVCQSFEMKPDDTVLQLSGMIDTGSSLYTNLYRYFLHVELAGLPGNATFTEAIKHYPPHFFSYLFTQALCV